MELFTDGKLNPLAFAEDVRRGTGELNDVLVAAAKSRSARIESTHWLIALAGVHGGATQKSLARFGLPVEDWRIGLTGCAASPAGALPPAQMAESSFDESALKMLREARTLAEKYARGQRLNEPILLLAGLRHLTQPAAELFADRAVGIDLPRWCRDLEDSLKPVTPVAVWAGDEPGTVQLPAFSTSGRRILHLMRSEAESLGFIKADSRHLLLALLEFEGGATQYGLFHQGVVPRKVHQTVMLSMRGPGQRGRSQVPLVAAHLQPLLVRILDIAGELAGRAHVTQISEPHLLRAFLSMETSARRMLEDGKVNTTRLREIAEEFEVDEEPAAGPAAADVATIRTRLRERLVGQEEAIERVLHYVERMQFGFTTPGRPVGTFLFCGQSGSGKTEMAKELARAIYGSEENLIFLEMGQFNSPESMNIFVGAPPGYIGYGEGKLTNGLRDKPQAVVLFDEVEKAHAKVLDALLRFLDEGKIDDPAGPVRDGSQCLLVLTSNVGAEELSRIWDEIAGNPNWKTVVRSRLRQEFRQQNFRPEFLNRVDELILFRTLKRNDYAEISRRLLDRDLKRLREERQIEVHLAPDVCDVIGQYCEQLGEGARAAQRLTQSVVITPVIQHVLRNKCAPPVRVKVSAAWSAGNATGEPQGTVHLW